MQMLRFLGVMLFILLSSASSAETTKSYILAPGDQIAISVFGESDLSMEFTLSDDGALNYPFLGEVQVSGMTMPGLEKHIADGLRGDYLINPDVTVSIKQYRPFFVNGEVNQPGGYAYQPGLTLEKALALAGGISPRASRSKIKIKRAADSTGTVTRIKMSDPVYAGDVITVPQSLF